MKSRCLRRRGWSLGIALLTGCGGTPAMNGLLTPTDAPDGATPSALDAGTSPPDASSSPEDASTPREDAGTSRDAGVVVVPAGPLWRQSAASGDLAKFALDEAIAAQDGALEIRAGGGHDATDPYPAGSWHGGNFYNGATYHYASATSPEHVFPMPFDSVTPSFDVATPPGTWVHVKLSARVAGAWTKQYSLGVWASDNGTVTRHSVDNQGDASGDVQTDTLVLAKPADALKITVVLFAASAGATPRVRGLAAVAQDTSAPPPQDTPDRAVWGKNLQVPMRSQMLYANGGEVWCSPTSTSMLLAYWSAKLGKPELVETVPLAADRTYDSLYAGNGNWPFNTAHAASMGGGALHGFVTRLASFAQVERLVKAEVPVAISVAYGAGELTGSPIPSTDGHLIVARGFASNGDVVCNDPAFPSDAQVEVTYKRDELLRAWKNSNGTTYVLWPAQQPLPVDPLGAFY